VGTFSKITVKLEYVGLRLSFSKIGWVCLRKYAD